MTMSGLAYITYYHIAIMAIPNALH